MHIRESTIYTVKYYLPNSKPSLLAGKANLRSQKEKPGAREVQICSRLQDQRAEETDGAKRERNQENEGTN